MSMYVDLLAGALDTRLEVLTGDDLVGHVVLCRSEMLASAPYKETSAYTALATEVAYDRALLKLCQAKNIEVLASDFAHPACERRRLETELMGAGINLAALARRQDVR
jgi:hypothetical protein